MTDIVLTPITSGYNVSKINSNFDKIEQAINDEVLNTVGGNNVMLQDLDMNGHALLNLATNPGSPDSMLTVAGGDARYYNITGDSLQGEMDVNGQRLINLPVPTAPSQPVRKNEFDVGMNEERSQRISADANLQAQISGGAPLEASAFSPISWHAQTINNPVDIPANKNAWSFGPFISVGVGVVISVGAGSYWTIANGELQ